MTFVLDSLFRELQTTLTGAGAVFGTRVYKNIVPAGVARPYALYMYVAGGATHRTKNEDSHIQVQIKCVSDDEAEAMQGAGEIVNLFRDAGAQSDGTATGDANWQITTVLIGNPFTLAETFDNAQVIYHHGQVFQFQMERI